MLVGIHQLHYLPWLRYFEKIARSDVFIVLDNIQYNKNGWQNRNRIKTPQGELVLTVPVLDAYAQSLDEVVIDNHGSWQKKHWRSMQQSYSKAPHYASYAPFLESCYGTRWELLNDLNRHMLDGFIEALGITTQVVYASELDVPGTATERLVNLIQAVGGTQYYSGAYALDAYLDAAALKAAGIELVLQQWHAPDYPQLHGPFIPDLSILDLIMNCGPNALRTILDANEHSP